MPAEFWADCVKLVAGAKNRYRDMPPKGREVAFLLTIVR